MTRAEFIAGLLAASAAAAAPGARSVSKRERFVGDRPADFRQAYTGKPLFSAKSGDRFGGFDVADVGNGVIFCGQPVDGLTVTDIEAVNVHRFLETVRGAKLSNFVLKNITVRGAERGFARIWEAENGIIEAVRADGAFQVGDPFAMGLHLEGRCRNITIRDVVMENFHGPDADYPNGDGVAVEGESRAIRILNSTMRNNRDAGCDLKGEGRLDGVTADANGFNFRFWGRWTAGRLVSRNPRRGAGLNAQVGGSVVVDYVVFDHQNGAPLIKLDQEGSGEGVRLRSYEITPRTPRGTLLIKRESHGPEVDWGPLGAPRSTKNKNGDLVLA